MITLHILTLQIIITALKTSKPGYQINISCSNIDPEDTGWIGDTHTSSTITPAFVEFYLYDTTVLIHGGRYPLLFQT
ncbi:hypothetical protein [Saccharicrinis sp. FJH54]|uniref:hypothetical protein n=1 Tax=Saccharicrinis sp. FJH54 TaxID=3344665 RepID=UPI0035D4B82D